MINLIKDSCFNLNYFSAKIFISCYSWLRELILLQELDKTDWWKVMEPNGFGSARAQAVTV